MSVSLPVSYDDVAAAARLLDGVAHRTPIMTSRTLDAGRGTVLLKCENFQRAGAFKFRGAYNALCHHREANPGGGVITFSSGNHAQAMSLAGRLLGIPVTIVMPKDAPAVKLQATRDYGGEVVLYDRDETTREALGEQLAAERGSTIIPAYDHEHVIAGQGTVAKELIEEGGELEALLVCLGGGGLLAGCALAARELSPNCRIIGVEPELADDGARSFHSGTLHSVHNPPTIADGARTPSLGQLNFEIIRALVDDVVTVSEQGIVEAMKFLWERMKLVVEPTGALAVAALLEGRAGIKPGTKVGATISGGNVDLSEAGRLFERHGQPTGK